LDSLSKIIIATGQINYMAVSIDSVNEQMKFIPDEKGYHSEVIKQFDEALSDTVGKLAEIMEDLGNLINGRDAICHIDTRVAKVPFEIIVAGMDDCEKDYEDDDESQNES
jgi:hypothetical protein